MSKPLSPSRPYLLRAFYEWLLDNELTPHLVVEADLPGVQVPRQFVEDGQIVLNIAPHAVGNLQMGNEEVTFNARFGGQPHALRVPMYAVAAIYARENGAGTVFQPEEAYQQPELSESEEVAGTPAPERPKGRPTLKVIK
ncbi:ClpXP protease specificity-enhancing factor [Ferrimonas balearica]|uniref:ClpXP protease specificity-enhancing factor n=1 Tax=Ferrimonas balearica TaxID=44012 RepID=UPI001C99B1DE|nr:ClpXP protease specificity-enhancing factor [Ferrimonas balearica]MBY5922449.1 ClpXP protease specificity-enhancing factor [Ferrimonas balearica]MBY5995433.1 ClpXP protease specificity-enhancing factor [Ferrimonas balearica]